LRPARDAQSKTFRFAAILAARSVNGIERNQP
jgi:hypothetical protein